MSSCSLKRCLPSTSPLTVDRRLQTISVAVSVMDVGGDRSGWTETMVKEFRVFWNHVSHTSIRKLKNWPMFCNLHKEGKGNVHRYSDLSDLPRIGRWQVSHYTHTHLPRWQGRHIRGQRALHPRCSSEMSLPRSHSWQWDRQ